MPTTPRRWPVEVESEREQALQETMEAIHYLQQAQKKADNARSKVHTNQGFAIVLLADTSRLAADAMTALERVQRFISVSKAKPITAGRWPIGASRQRDDVRIAAEDAIKLLVKAHDMITQAREKIFQNPSLAEAMIADMTQLQARSITLAERINRLLTEAAFGRE